MKTKHKIKVLKLQLLEHKSQIEVLLKIMLLNKKQSLNELYYKINQFNKEKILEAGYAVIYDTNNNHINSIKSYNQMISFQLN